MKVICSILLGVFLTISVPCASGFVPCTFQQERLLFSLSARDEQNVKEEPNEKCYSVGRRSMLATCSTLMAPIVLLPAGASSSTVETEVEPDFDCLLDLPSVAKDHVRLYLCRHGQTENNRLRKVQGARVDPPVNDNGALQALNLGKALARADPCPQVFFSSNLERARMTAGIAAKQVDPNIQPRQLPPLAEVDFGPIAEGKPIALAKAGMEATYAAWAMGNIDYRPSDGGDSGRDVSSAVASSTTQKLVFPF